jgi:hypothetical protein
MKPKLDFVKIQFKPILLILPVTKLKPKRKNGR